MKVFIKGILAGLVLYGIARAQAAPQQSDNATPPGQSVPGKGAVRIAPGSIIPVQLTKTIDAKKAKNGDQVEAKVTQDLKTASGEIVVPKDTKVVGHVTEAQAANQKQKESQLGITFDHAVMKNGSDASMPMSIQAIIAPRNPNADNDGVTNPAEPSIAQSNAGGMPPGGGNRPSAGMGNVPPVAPAPSAGTDSPSGSRTGSETRAPITAKTQGVVGIPNLTLSPVVDANQGSVVSSEKGSVKLESGTWMLLRVNPTNP